MTPRNRAGSLMNRRGFAAMGTSAADSTGGQPVDHVGVVVVEELRVALIEGGDLVHVVIGEREVEDVEVLRHPIRVDRLGDDDDVALDQPAQHDLGDGLAVLLADAGQKRVGEQPVLALRERSPRLDLHTLGGEDS